MKLIDILVEELPKRGGWPEGAKCITQDGCLRVEPAACHPSVAKCDGDGFWFFDSSRIGGFEVDTLASDYTTAIITREQYESALTAKNDGWIAWGGGECPVQTGVLVDVRYGDGVEEFALEANMPNKTRFRTAAAAWWRKDGNYGDIIAYRLHQPTKSEQVRADAWNAYAGITEADYESDLNECIGHDTAPVWSGEGLPPVGCECELMKSSIDAPKRVKIIAHFQNNAAMVAAYIPAENKYKTVDQAIACCFRPIRSEAERKRDEAVQALCDAGGGNGKVDEKASYGSCWFDVYDAIAAGKIPGVKLEG